MIKIDKGVPTPTTSAAGSKPLYPWRSMDVGDSFYVEGVPRGTIGSSANGAAARIGGGVRFTVRKEGVGVRVWRVS